MSTIKDRATNVWIKSKAEPVARRVNQSLAFPITASSIKKVLVILPRNLNLIDRASLFVQSMRKNYPTWRIELFDVDKLNKTDLNRMQLPRPEIVDRLRDAGYHLVVDLNDRFDQLSSYIALMTEAHYRLKLGSDDGLEAMYYNMAFQLTNPGNGIEYDPLLKYLSKLFIRQ